MHMLALFLSAYLLVVLLVGMMLWVFFLRG
jgi:hypothetical protein